MKKLISTSIAAALLATSVIAVTPASAQDRGGRDRFIEQFYMQHGRDDDYWRWKRGGWRDDDYHSWYNHRRDRFDGGDAAAAAIFGLAAGAITGAIVSGANQGAANFEGSDWHYQCSLKYNSYDPSSGTFLGYDGYRHQCTLP